MRQTSRGLLLDVKATPKSARDEISGLSPMADGSHSLSVKITAPPDKGKANAAIIALLAKQARIPKSALELVSGDTDRHKVFVVRSHSETLQNWLMDVAQKQA